MFRVCEALAQSLGDVKIATLRAGSSNVNQTLLLAAIKAEPHDDGHPTTAPTLLAKAFAEDVISNALVNIRVGVVHTKFPFINRPIFFFY